MDFLLDPHVISLPKKFSDGTQVEAYLNTLKDWTNRSMQKGHKFWVSAPALLAIFESKRFPNFSQLQKMHQKLSNDDLLFDATTASRACQHLSEPPYLDDELANNIPEINDVLPDDDRTIVIPDEIARRLSPDVASGLRQTLGKLAYAQQIYNLNLANEIFFATSHLEGPNGHVDINSLCLHPKSIEWIQVDGEWLTISDPSDLDRMVDLEKNWDDTEQMIRWAYQDLLMSGHLQKDIHEDPSELTWFVGKRFNESILKEHFNRASQLAPIFRTVVKVLVGFWPRQTDSAENHALQRDHKQIRREKDNALAWRAYVTRHSPTIRLHYWVMEDGHIEFSKVGVHNDYSIE